MRSEIMDVVIKAFEIAAAGRPGPVYIDLPQDILEGTAAVDDSLRPVFRARPLMPSLRVWRRRHG